MMIVMLETVIILSQALKVVMRHEK